MRLWTSQRIGFYKDVIDNGIAYCDRISYWAKHNDIAYKWMAEQMRLRIGEPPLPQITMPVWAWYQYDSRKKKKPPLSPLDKGNNSAEMMMEIEVPDNEVLLYIKSPQKEKYKKTGSSRKMNLFRKLHFYESKNC